MRIQILSICFVSLLAQNIFGTHSFINFNEVNPAKCNLENSLLENYAFSAQELDKHFADMSIMASETTSACVFDSITTLNFSTDNFGAETSWKLFLNGEIIADGQNYTSNTEYSEDFVLFPGYYIFVIYDAQQDGMCCSNGEGSYQLVSGNTTISSGGEFGDYEHTFFCVEAAPIVGCMDAEAHNYNPDATFHVGVCETCDDGVLNGDETEVDCGGEKCAPCGNVREYCYSSNESILTVNSTDTESTVSWSVIGEGVELFSGTNLIVNGTLTESFNLPDGVYTVNVFDNSGAYSFSLDNGGETIIFGENLDSANSFTFCIEAVYEIPVLGCMDSTAHNYNADATLDSGICETCSDGILNGDEEDVDCGGLLCEPCEIGCPSERTTTLVLQTDGYGYETTWYLKRGSRFIDRGRRYRSNRLYTLEFNLRPGDYTLVIKDSHGDGMCCEYGDGFYTLTNGNTTIASGGDFGSREVIDFCIGRNSNREIAGNDDGLVSERSQELPALGNIPQKDPIRVFPNPAMDYFALDLTDVKDVVAVQMVSITGKEVKRLNVEKAITRVDISDLKYGIYFITVQTQNGILKKKIIKQG